MRERPILFSGPMVRALLAGTKTQTRRVVKPQPDIAIAGSIPGTGTCGRFTPQDERLGRLGEAMHCPYGQPGDRLWVRETWGYFDPDCTGEDYDAEHESAGPGPAAFCDELLQEGHPLRDFWRRRVAYKATFAEGKYGMGPVGPKKWRPSIHMPRWASRLTLEITGVRVERLKDISEADAIAEGIEKTEHGFWSTYGQLSVDGTYSPSVSYHALWQSINGADGQTSWSANPWVWVVEFKRLDTPAA